MVIPRPELPTVYQRRSTVYNVLPDIADLTWTVWDLDGCLGEISTDGDRWFWRHSPSDPLAGGHETWQEAAGELIGELPDLHFD